MHISYSSRDFEEKYTYEGRDLGAHWTPMATTFRLWAPTAEAVTVNLYRGGTHPEGDLLVQIPMKEDVQGTWVAQRMGNLNGLYYTYLVTVEGITREACDPYAVSTGVNGQRAMVLDLASTNPQGWETDKNPFRGEGIWDAVLYELHVRDLSSDRCSHIRHKGKFLGLTETGTRTRGGHSTGLDHIKALGITHLHLLPVFDYGYTDETLEAPQYNWGYDPVNYNVPEGSYATDPYHGEVRVREMKQLVKTLHDNGIAVVMDVVYNHVFDAGSFCFNRIVPGYFSRITDGVYANGSCCGNDTASERSMVRKYIVDSVNYWAEEYHIDGFRFDLVGLLDAGTVAEIVRTVHERHPDVIFYGEGWDMATAVTKENVPMAIQSNSCLLPGFSFFSDTLRDLMRGSVFYHDQGGYVTGGTPSREALQESFMGMPQWAAEPYQCVNYVSCHDNNTLFDRIAIAFPEASFQEIAKRSRLAAAFSILSQGVPFLQAGEELLRTKPGKRGGFDENSYRSPDRVNAIKWSTLDQESYQQNLRFYQGLIRFRKAHPALRLSTREQVLGRVHPQNVENPHAVAFLLEEQDAELFVAFNADTRAVPVALPQGKWSVQIRQGEAGTETLAEAEGSIVIPELSPLVLVKKKPVEVAAALIWEKDKFLICQRPAHKTRGMLWEFVGGKAEPGETIPEALIRECREELDVEVQVGDVFMQVLHRYPDIEIRLTLLHCTIRQGVPKLLEHNAMRWIHPSEIDNFDFCPADEDILKEIKRAYANHKPL